mgnify:CR=1 FL=1
MEEIWKDIKGYEGEYQVSSLGRVRSLDRYKYQKGRYGMMKRFYKGKILKADKDKDGYFIIKLRHKFFYKIHRLVAQTFLENLENKHTVNHKDGNKQNNAIDNLEWATEKENTQHAYKTGLIKPHMIGKKGKLSNNFKIRVQIDKNNGKIINEYSGAAEAERETGVNAQNISDCCNGKRKTAGGYIWRYKEE